MLLELFAKGVQIGQRFHTRHLGRQSPDPDVVDQHPGDHRLVRVSEAREGRKQDLLLLAEVLSAFGGPVVEECGAGSVGSGVRRALQTLGHD